MLFTVIEMISLLLTELYWPETSIDIVRPFETSIYSDNMREYGDHELYVDSRDVRNKKIENRVIDSSFKSEAEAKRFSRKNRFQTVKPGSEEPVIEQKILQEIRKIEIKTL